MGMMQRFIDSAKEKVKYTKCKTEDNYMEITKIMGENVFVDDSDIDEIEEKKDEEVPQNDIDKSKPSEMEYNLNGNDIEEVKDENDKNDELNDVLSINEEEYKESEQKQQLLPENNSKDILEEDEKKNDKSDIARKMLLDFDIP